MNADRWHRIKEAFNAARTRTGEARRSVLRNKCGDDPELLDEVRSLLQAEEEEGPADRLFDRVGAMLNRPALDDGQEGQTIGPYKLVEELGHGGMGRVFLARRADGEFDQRVALKLLGVNFPSPEARERFLAERQILATLSHPHIARLLDGGVTEAGKPYFVMEAVDGHPLDQYADENGLSIEERLELFLDVCDAVHYAHQNLVVHRDLKPSNILVTESGTVKLLDFGIAKLLDPEAMGVRTAPRTRTGWGPMTPKYASPEQVRGSALTTASDVYQLGIVLYELLAGRRPYHVDGQTPGEVESVVCEQEPVRPSASLRETDASPERAPSVELARQRKQMSLAQLRHTLRGDLDTIVMKTLRKEPDRRYDSAEQLAEDLRRVLEGRPVSAHPDSWAYRAGKFVRRNRGFVVGAAALVLLLIGYGITVTWYSQRTEAALDQARKEAQKSEQVTDFLVGMFERANPYQGGGAAQRLSDTLTTRELLDQGASRARQDLSQQPEVQATLMHTLGQLYRQYGHHDEAEALLEETLAIQNEHLPPTHPDRAKSLHERARLLRYEGKMDRATRLYRESLSIQRMHLGDEHPDIADNIRELAIIAAREGRYPRADSLFRKALAMRISLNGPDHPDVASEFHVLGLLHVLRGKLADAERLLRRSLAIRRRHVDDTHPLLAETMDRLGQVLLRRDNVEEAEPLIREAHTIRRDLFQQVHPSRAVSLNNLGRLLQKKGRYDAADSLHAEAQAIYRTLYGPESLDLANTLFERGEVHRAAGTYERAERLYTRALTMQRSLHGSDHPSVQRSLDGLSELRNARDAAGG